MRRVFNASAMARSDAAPAPRTSAITGARSAAHAATLADLAHRASAQDAGEPARPRKPPSLTPRDRLGLVLRDGRQNIDGQPVRLREIDGFRGRRSDGFSPSISLEVRFVHLECRAAHDRDSGRLLRRPWRHTATIPLSQEPWQGPGRLWFGDQ